MGGRFSGLGTALYDSKRKEVLGRDGAGWSKLGVFYFFFYLGLAGFFCAMLAVFMALTPRDHPYYTSHDSRMETRSNPLSPGLGFRPQPDVERNLVLAEKARYSSGKLNIGNDTMRFIDGLDKYLQVYYWKNGARNYNKNTRDRSPDVQEFAISNAGECTKNYKYGYGTGRPCVLVKMNKIVDFEPTALTGNDEESKNIPERCQTGSDSIPIACQGEYPADIDNVGPISYISESGTNYGCGSLKKSHFPYRGKQDRKDVYQAPYIWVQFTNPTPNILINVICRAYASNIDYDRKTGRGLTRFQIFVEDKSKYEKGSNQDL